MGAMSGAGMPQLGHVRLVDLIASDGLPSDAYKQAVHALSQSLSRFNMVVIQLPPGDDILLRCVLDSVRMFFHQRPVPGVDSVHSDDPADWNRTVGYYAEPHHVRELYDYRPGRSPAETSNGPELPPAGLPELFSTLGTATRSILDAIGCSMELRSFCFNDLLDNVPLKAGEVSTSVLSSCCYGRPGAHHSGGVPLPDQPHMPLFDDHEPHAEKGLLTLMKSDKPGLHIRDRDGRWILADNDLGPQDMVLFSGLSLYQATAGYLSPALHRTEISPAHSQMYGRCTVAFKLMPRATAILHCSAMTAADHAVAGPFMGPIVVQDFMQRPHPMDQLVTRPGLPSFSFPAPQEMVPFVADPALKTATMNKRRKQASRGKPLAPSKRLRLEAQRVLKERVQEIADSKGLKIRFCNFKDCEEQHISSLDSPCAAMRAEMGWPAGVPFVHPHDLPNKAKQAFLEAYEPGWTAAQDGELGLLESGHAHHNIHALTGAPLLEDQRFAVRTVYEYLRAKGKPVPTGKPQVVGHKVDLSGLAKACYDAGGRAQVLVCHCSSPYTQVLRVVQGFLEMMASVKMGVILMTQVWGQQDHLYLSVQCSHAGWAAKVEVLSELVSAGWIRCLIYVDNNARTSEVEKLLSIRPQFCEFSLRQCLLSPLVSYLSSSESLHCIRLLLLRVVNNCPSLSLLLLLLLFLILRLGHGFFCHAYV